MNACLPKSHFVSRTRVHWAYAKWLVLHNRLGSTLRPSRLVPVASHFRVANLTAFSRSFSGFRPDNDGDILSPSTCLCCIQRHSAFTGKKLVEKVGKATQRAIKGPSGITSSQQKPLAPELMKIESSVLRFVPSTQQFSAVPFENPPTFSQNQN